MLSMVNTDFEAIDLRPILYLLERLMTSPSKNPAVFLKEIDRQWQMALQ
jgi:hypothetical protein